MITAQLVKDLREKTGAGMMDCKKVLTETDGDMEKAIELLRERGLSKAAKKSGRIAAEGLAAAYVSADKKIGVAVEVNAEIKNISLTFSLILFKNNAARINTTPIIYGIRITGSPFFLFNYYKNFLFFRTNYNY